MRVLSFFLAVLALAFSAGAAAASDKKEANQVTAKYGDAQILVSGGGAASPSKQTATFPKSASSSGSLTAKAGQFLYVTFSVTDAGDGAALKPHQTFVRLTNAKTGVSSFFVAKPDASSNEVGRFKIELPVSDRKALRDATEPGDYDVFVIVGDAALTNPVEWKVGTVNLQPPAAPAKPSVPLYTQPLLHDSDTTLVPLKEISHIFRNPERRPHAIVSLVAAGLIVAVVVGWIGYALSIPGARVSIPLASFIWAVGFHGSLAAVFVLFGLYWLRLTMFTTLGWLAILAVPLTVFGRQLLVSLQKRDARAATKKE